MGKKIMAAFQTWNNGGLQTSAFYSREASEVHGLSAEESSEMLDAFVRNHYASGTFATLHTFEDIESAKKEYLRLIHN